MTFLTEEKTETKVNPEIAFLQMQEGRGGGGEEGEKWVGAIDRQANNGHSL